MNNVRCALSCLVWRCMERKSRRVARLLLGRQTLDARRIATRRAGARGSLVHGHACYRCSLKGQHSTLLRLWYMYRTLCQLQLAPRQDVCVSCPSLSTAYPRLAHLLHASASLAELCVTAMLLHCQGAARRSSCLFQKEPPSACASALLSATGVLLDHLGGTAAPPATCGSAHARCDWGRGPLS